ncbi:partial putative membrane protein YdfK, partial [Anaerolineales bacterium]
YNLLAVKSTLDGFASIAFASTLGVGVLFSALPILVYQGGVSLLANQLHTIVTDPMMAEMTATGGILLIGVGISNLLDIKRIRVGNFLPALIAAPLIVWALSLFEI